MITNQGLPDLQERYACLFGWWVLLQLGRRGGWCGREGSAGWVQAALGKGELPGC
jgi:hypothetical protein